VTMTWPGDSSPVGRGPDRSYWDGLSTKEIAARFAIPDGTVKSRLHDALRILRAQLEADGLLR